MLKRWQAVLAACLRTAWVGSTWAVGYLAVPVLFGQLDDRMQAGELAGVMFGRLAWLGVVCGLVLLLIDWRDRFARGLLLAMLACVLAGHFGLQPAMAELKLAAAPSPVMDSPHAAAFRQLHAVSSVIYLLQALAGLVLVGRAACRPRTAALSVPG